MLNPVDVELWNSK